MTADCGVHDYPDELALDLATKAPGDLVFTAPKGGVLRNTNFRPRAGATITEVDAWHVSSRDQVQALAEACAPYGTLIKVLAYAGLRWGELVAPTTRRVDLKRRRIEVVEAITEVHGRVIVGTTKTHQRRSVPIPRFLADELPVELATNAPGDLVFTAPEGGVLWNTNFRPRFFDPGAEKAGLPPGLASHELVTLRQASLSWLAPMSRRCSKCSATPRRP